MYEYYSCILNLKIILLVLVFTKRVCPPTLLRHASQLDTLMYHIISYDREDPLYHTLHSIILRIYIYYLSKRIFYIYALLAVLSLYAQVPGVATYSCSFILLYVVVTDFGC